MSSAHVAKSLNEELEQTWSNSETRALCYVYDTQRHQMCARTHVGRLASECDTPNDHGDEKA